jgi:hypothetical protein
VTAPHQVHQTHLPPKVTHSREDGRWVTRGNGLLPPITGLFLTRRSHLGGATSDSADAMGTIPAMPDELSVDVFTELGRVTWAAIKLEDYVEGLCSHIDPANPRTDRRQVSTKIRDAQRVLAARTRSATRDEAAEWLEHARQAIERRNAAMHATPIVWVGRKHAEERLGLGEMPRKGRPYFERPLTVESLSELRSVLENAADGWRDLVIALDTESMR